MATYVILSQLRSGDSSEPREFKRIAGEVSQRIKNDCPGVQWKTSYATMGRFDVVDVVEADDPKQVEKAAMIIRAYGNAKTETMVATPWHEFIDAL